jgi:hypothetical protein
MVVKILLRNKVEQEIETNSTTELQRKVEITRIDPNEGTPKNG